MVQGKPAWHRGGGDRAVGSVAALVPGSLGSKNTPGPQPSLPAPPLHKLFGLQPTFGWKKVLPGRVALKVGPRASRPWIGIGPGSLQALGRLPQCNSAETISHL